MVLTEIQTHIHFLSRPEKYSLIEFIVGNLSQEETLHLSREATVATSSHPEPQTKARAIDTFIRKWKGSLHGIDPDQEKYLYLQEKYG